MTYTLWLWLMTMTSILWLWLSHITRDYDLSPLMTFISYHLSSITITYDLWPIPQNHHLWLIIHNSSHMSMISHPWLLYMTIIHDLSHLWLSGLLPMTITYDLWPITMIYDLWLSLITHNCHSWLSMTMTDHMSLMTYSEPWLITYDHCSWLSRTITHDYHPWLWTLLMNITYDHQTLWLMIHHLWVSHKTVTHDYHPWLCPSHMTMPITWLTTADHDCHPWLWLSPMTMTATHDYDCHPWLWISLTIYHHSWLAYITRDYHLCMSPMTVTDPLSLVMTTYHPWHSSHKTITNDHDYHSSLMTMTSYSQLAPMPYHSCLIIHVLSLMSIYDHDSWPSWLMIYNSSLVTITSDHHSWPSFMTIRSDHLTSHPWLLTHGY